VVPIAVLTAAGSDAAPLLDHVGAAVSLEGGVTVVAGGGPDPDGEDKYDVDSVFDPKLEGFGTADDSVDGPSDVEASTGFSVWELLLVDVTDDTTLDSVLIPEDVNVDIGSDSGAAEVDIATISVRDSAEIDIESHVVVSV